VLRVRDQQSASHRTGVKVRFSPPWHHGCTDESTKLLRGTREGQNLDVLSRAVGNIAALIPRAARVRLLEALIWASHVEAAALE
jgi:hypothetical protein